MYNWPIPQFFLQYPPMDDQREKKRKLRPEPTRDLPKHVVFQLFSDQKAIMSDMIRLYKKY